MNWYLSVLKKYAIFSGRARRKEYWMFVLISSLISLALFFVDMSIGTFDPVTGEVGYGFLYPIYVLLFLLPSIAVTVRRLHDTGRSGLWLLAPILLLVPALYLNIYHFGRFGFLNLIAVIISLILLFIVFLFMFLDSQKGDNKYGKNPKQSNKEQEVNKNLDNVVNHAITYPDVFVKLIPSQYPLTVSDLRKYPEKDAKGMIFGVLANLSGIEINLNSNIDMAIMATLTKATDRIYEGICK